MTTTCAVSTAKKRKTKTRTKHVSPLPALALSSLFPQHIDLGPGTESLVCPDCTTWCPITGHDSLTPKLVPHHTRPAGTVQPRRCKGTNRRIQLDLTVAEWQQRLTEAITETAARSATTVLSKPQTAPTPAVSQLTPAPATPATAHKAYRAHVTQCSTCTGPSRCAVGRRLVDTVERLERQEPRRRRVREFFARERARFDRVHAVAAKKARDAEWAAQARTAATRGELAKRSGTALEDLNNVCRAFQGPELPLTWKLTA